MITFAMYITIDTDNFSHHFESIHQGYSSYSLAGSTVCTLHVLHSEGFFFPPL
mgnify:FL=1